MNGRFENREQFSVQRTLIDLRSHFQLRHDLVRDVLNYELDWHLGLAKMASK